MKKFFKVFAVLVFVLSLTTLVSCKCNKGKNEEPKEVAAKGYALVNGDYIGIADIKVKDGVVTALTFEEVYLPSHWAGLANVEGVDEALYVSYQGSYGPVNAAKYVMVGDKKFTATLVEGAPVYSAEGIADLKAWLNASEENAKWYAEKVLAGEAKATTASWEKALFQITADIEGGYTKSTTGYWPAGGYGQGWKANVEGLAKTLVGTKMGFTESQIVKGEDGKYSIGGNTTTASLASMKDYVAVAQKAYNAATK